jgi:hypothetical protein
MFRLEGLIHQLREGDQLERTTCQGEFPEFGLGQAETMTKIRQNRRVLFEFLDTFFTLSPEYLLGSSILLGTCFLGIPVYQYRTSSVTEDSRCELRIDRIRLILIFRRHTHLMFTSRRIFKG